MFRSLSAAVSALAAVLCLLLPAGASGYGYTGYSEFGDDCAGDATEAGWTTIGLNNGKSYPELSSDAGPHELRGGNASVITRWKVNLAPGMGPLAQQLVAFRGTENGVAKVGESAIETLVDGSNEFATRIPIPEYARIGLHGPVETLYCDNRENSILGFVTGDFPPGQDRSYSVLLGKSTPGVAVVERDEDGDGYGDLTQDGCPRSAEFHDACPYAQITGRVEAIRRGAILIAVSTNIATRVQVAGRATWPDPYHRKGERAVALSGGIQPLAANGSAVFRVPLPKVMIRHLNRTRPGKKVKAQLLLTRLDRLEELPGWVNKSLVVKLPGRDRKAPKR